MSRVATQRPTLQVVSADGSKTKPPVKTGHRACLMPGLTVAVRLQGQLHVEPRGQPGRCHACSCDLLRSFCTLVCRRFMSFRGFFLCSATRTVLTYRYE